MNGLVIPLYSIGAADLVLNTTQNSADEILNLSK